MSLSNKKSSVLRSRKTAGKVIGSISAASVLSSAAFLTSMTTPVMAQDSEFTRQGAGPMYFMTYEHQWTKNTFMPEQRFKDNIDWMAEQFRPYGYDMVSLDGWIEGATLLNKNGYVVSHNDKWMTQPLGSASENTVGQLVNGGFEEGVDNGWMVETNASFGVDANDAYDGSKLWIYHPDPHTASVSQTVAGLEDGNYTVTARVKFPNDVQDFVDGTSIAHMKLTGYADGEPAPEQSIMLNDALTDEYGKARYGLFELQADVTNGKLTISFDVDAKGEHSSFQLDNVELYKTGEKPADEEEEGPFQYPAEKYPDGHTWKYWGDYLAEKGMDFGIYYNPLWVSPEVVKNPEKYIVKGTENNPEGPTYVADLIDKGDPDDLTDGDRFNGGQGSERALYWVDVNHPDAEKYVKGYLDFFSEEGADFLRVDFLSWYETGTDANMGTIGRSHSRDNYETQLKWMSEAAKENGIFLSLVMPHLKDHGEAERKYGDMIRINEDTFEGGWQHISGRRQEWRPGWSQWANSFQGFTGFSDIGGRSSLILDGDFLRLNTFSGDFAESEKKTTLSLYSLAGSPIAISDQFDTIGDNAKYYQNTELIEFNKMGLAGKPIYESDVPYSETNDSRNSQQWAGQLPDGSWAVGLFNRDDEPQTFDFNFAEELGFSKGFVRDVWAHKDLGINSGHSVTLGGHDSVVLKVVPAEEEKTYQSEVASYEEGITFSNQLNGHTGFGYLTGFDKENEGVTYAVSVPADGTYELDLTYSSAVQSNASIHVRDIKSGETTSATETALPETGEEWSNAGTKLDLREGTNLIHVQHAEGHFNLDAITLKDLQERKDSVQNGDFDEDFSHWSRSNMINQSVTNGVVHIQDKNGEPFSSDLWQYVVPEEGTYKLTANVTRSGPFDEAVLYVENGDSRQTVDIIESADAKTVTIPNIKVSEGNVLKIGNLVNGQPGGVLTIDNIKLVPEETTFHNDYFHIIKKPQKIELSRNQKKQEDVSSYLVKISEQSEPRMVQAANQKYKQVSSLEEVKKTKEVYFFNKDEDTVYISIPREEMRKIQVKY